MTEPLVWLAPAAAFAALVFAGVFFREMLRRDEGTELMRRIGGHVRHGAMAYLRQQYRVMALVFAALAAMSTGCASLPPPQGRTDTYALTGTQETRLGRALAAHVGGRQGATGVHALPQAA